MVDPGEAGSTTDVDATTTTIGATSSMTTAPMTTLPTTVADTGSADSSSNPTMTSLNFIENDTGGDPAECDIWDQDCPVGEKCMPWANDGGNAWNATRCSPIAEDPHGVGESCTVEGSGVSGIDDCGLRAMCWDVDPETLMGECVAFCMGTEANPICKDACSQCPIGAEGVLILCLPICDPIVQDCGEGEGCYPVDAAFSCAPDASGDMGGIGEVCEYLNACDAGTACIGTDLLPACEGPISCCSPFCDLAAVDDCDSLLPGTVCRPWYDEPGPQGCTTSEIGVCALPP